MKLLFVENRNKTIFYEKIADKLKKDHTIIFLTYNELFKAKNHNNYILKSIPDNKINRCYTKDIKKILDADRGINNFNIKKNHHVFKYKEEIENALSKINPDIIFGESTLFYEQLVINWAKKHNLLYLHPTGYRYPPNRLVFFKYDTMIPFKGSNDILSDFEYLDIIDKIITGNIKPDYMKDIKRPLITKMKYYFLITLGNILYDKYLTPNILRKYFIEKQKNQNIKTWDNFAFDDFKKEPDIFYILYPLQMQPEMNIDYWGYPNFNQVALLNKIIELTAENIRVIVKPNPKSKYEMSEDLIKLIKSSPRFIPLSHSVKMKDIFNKVDLFVTNTGTISLECFFANKPCITLGNFDNEFIAKTELNDIKQVVFQIQNKIYKFPKDNDKLNLLKYFLTTSYSGTIGDPIINPNILNYENIKLVHIAFEDIINKYAT